MFRNPVIEFPYSSKEGCFAPRRQNEKFRLHLLHRQVFVLVRGVGRSLKKYVRVGTSVTEAIYGSSEDRIVSERLESYRYLHFVNYYSNKTIHAGLIL